MTRSLLLAALAALLLAGCGGSSQGGGTKPETPAVKRPSESPGKGSSPEKPQYEAGEESVERYGSEAKGQSREAILSAGQAYLSALGEKDFEAACSRLAASVTDSLKNIASRQLKSKGCPTILPKLLSPAATPLARRQAEGEIKTVRVHGDRAFVIFHALGARLWILTMLREGGSWKVATIAASVLAPSAATLR